jgi:hypothetical protein
MFVFFPEPPQGEGMRPTIPHPILDWIRNQIHYITGDDPATPTLEGTLNLLAEKLLQNDRALLDYLDLMASSVSVVQQILNSIVPGKNRIHADNTFRNYHQDADFDLDLRHTDSLIYSDTWIVGAHQDENYTGTHSDSGYHQDKTVIHSDSHGDHTDHYDQSHGDRSSSHSDHSDHSDFSHSDSHGDSTNPHTDTHSDHTDNIHYDQSTVHSDSHSDHFDHNDQVHGDVLHANYSDTRHDDIAHANVAHSDYFLHDDYFDHTDFADFRDHGDHRDIVWYYVDTPSYIDHGDHNDHLDTWY